MAEGPAATTGSEGETLGGLLAARWPEDPGAVLIETAEGASIGYGQAWARAGQIAGALVASGVRPGDRVAVQVEKSPLVVLLYLACIRAGAVLLPLNPAYTDEEVAYLVGDAEPAVLVRDPARVGPPPAGEAPGDRDDPGDPSDPSDRGDRVGPVTTGRQPVVLTADAVGAGTLANLADVQPVGFDDVLRGPDDLAALVYTSGTTGRPKGAMLTHRNLASNAVTLHRAWGFRPDDVLLHALPLFHVHGLFVAINCVLANGTGMVLLPRFDTGAVLDQLGRCTVLMGVPTFYSRLLADPRFDTERCTGVRLLISGSAPLPATVHDEVRRRTGHAVLERYGTTETSMITSNPLHGERRPGTVGRPLPGVEVRVTSAGRADGVGDVGDVGDIEVRGPNVFPGYWRRPELSATEHTADGWFRTGDLGRLDADGYLTIVGRAKDLIISGGLNVYPKEVEDVLDQLDGVQESAVVGVPDPDLGEAVVAVVVAELGGAVDGAEVRRAARQRLAAFKVPKRVHVVDALPRNAMGKVEKARLRADLRPAAPGGGGRSAGCGGSG